MKLDVYNIRDLERLLHDRKTQIRRLEKKRSRMERQLRSIDQEIVSIGGRANGHSRAKNEEPLAAAIEGVLKKGGAMNVGQIADQVRRRGYHSSSANFRGIVNQALIKEKQFVQTGRGVYKLK